MKNKNILLQYADLQQEIKEISQRIAMLKEKLERIEEEGNVKDAVKGGAGNLQTFHIEGFPVADAEETVYLIKKNMRILRERKEKAQEMLIEGERYINSIDDSRIRRMAMIKYIEGETWEIVAMRMGRMYTGESCRKQMERFLKNI